jgi:TonB-like protein
MPILALAAALFVVWTAPADAARRRGLDTLGTWTCVVYGHPAFGDERILLNFAPDGSMRLAREQRNAITGWTTLHDWDRDGDVLTFTDSRTGRRFEADLTRPTLGGSWRAPTLLGGWWCSAADFVPVPHIEEQAPTDVMPPLLPTLTATPHYPIQAIRKAKQGRAVTCFFVDASGYIVQPQVVEISDEIFRQPILNALSRSRYQGWTDERILRPGCRSFIFKLDALSSIVTVD